MRLIRKLFIVLLLIASLTFLFGCNFYSPTGATPIPIEGEDLVNETCIEDNGCEDNSNDRVRRDTNSISSAAVW